MGQMKNFLKKMFGLEEMEKTLQATQAKLDELEQIKKQAEEAAQAKLDELEQIKKQAEEAAQKALEAEEQSKLTPKERATRNQEPWVSVLDTHVNKDNIRNGFFELDWNEYFIVQLKQAGYGADGDRDEDIVDRWFRDIVYNMFAESGVDTSRGAGYINVVPISKGKSEVS